MNSAEDVAPTPEILPSLDPSDPRRYNMDMDWVWSRKHNPGLRKQATVLATVKSSDPERLARLFAAWTKHLHEPNSDGVFVQGGWFCEVKQAEAGLLVLLFGSGGQDVAESLDYGVQWFSGAVLGAIPGATVTWQELPLTGLE